MHDILTEEARNARFERMDAYDARTGGGSQIRLCLDCQLTRLDEGKPTRQLDAYADAVCDECHEEAAGHVCDVTQPLTEQLRQSIAANWIESELRNVWFRHSPSISQHETQALRMLAEQAVSLAVPGARMQAESRARVAFAKDLALAMSAQLAGETHSQKHLIAEALLTFCQTLTRHTTSPLHGVFAAYGGHR